MRSRAAMVPRQRGLVALGVVLALVAVPVPASGYTFHLVSDGSGQLLTWYWYDQYPAESCMGTPPFCAQTFSVNGLIPSAFANRAWTRTGGMLDWTGQSGTLQVAGMLVGAVTPDMIAPYQATYAEVWVALDARTTPMVFQVLGEPGDPLFLDLQILPRLVGSMSLTDRFVFPESVGDFTNLFFSGEMSVAVNGLTVSRDTLNREFRFVDQSYTWALALPGGAANYTLVPGVPVGSQVTITFWLYMRMDAAYAGSVTGTSPYGFGPALEILVRDARVTAVDEEVPAPLSLAASPNPARGTTRFSYAVTRAGAVRLSVFDMAGRRVATPVDQVVEAGRHEVVWELRDSGGQRLGPGVYLVDMTAGAERTIGKLVVLGR